MDTGGYYGKRPMERDFVFDGLAAGASEAWAGIMSDWLVSIQSELPESWLELYFEAPAWRFAIAPGLMGKTGWCGLLSASADAFGRSFPLAVLMPLEGAIHQLVFRAAVEITLDTLEVQTMAFIEGNLSREEFQAAIAGHAETLARIADHPTPRTPMHLGQEDKALRISFARTDGEAIIAGDALVCSTSQAAVQDLPLSYWWQDGGSTRSPELCIWKGLPGGRETGGFFSGDWRRFGWKRAQIDPDLVLRP
ncbi:type VI secretion system-associated protein TagF [Roseibium sp. M-1]